MSINNNPLLAGRAFSPRDLPGFYQEYLFDEGSGPSIRNTQANGLQASGNWLAPQSVIGLGFGGTGTVTANNAAGPIGTGDATTCNLTAGTRTVAYTLPSLPAGTYTYSVWFRSTSGSPTATTDGTPSISSTSIGSITGTWTKFSRTFTVATALTAFNLKITGVGNSEFWNPCLVSGSTAGNDAPAATAQEIRLLDPAKFSWTTGGLTGGASIPMGIAYGPTKTWTRCSMYALAYLPAVVNDAPLVDTNATRTLRLSAAGDSSATNYKAPLFAMSTSASAVGASSRLNGSWHVLCGTYDGTTSRCYVDGLEVGSVTDSGKSVSMPIANWNFGVVFSVVTTGVTGGFWAYDQRHTDDQVWAMTQWCQRLLLSRGLSYNDGTKAIVFEGDSLTAGLRTTGLWGWRCPVIETYANVIQGRSFAVSGNTISNLQSRVATAMAPFKPWHAKKILTLFVGTNNLIGSTPAAVYASTKTLIDSYRALVPDIQILWATLPGRNDQTAPINAQFNLDRQTLRGLQIGDPYGCTIVDIANDPNIGTDAAPAAGVYFDADQLHFNDTGAAYIATDLYGPAILTAMS